MPVPQTNILTATDRFHKLMRGDHAFRWLTAAAAGIIPLLMIGLFVELLLNSRLAIEEFGLSFLYRSVWNPVTGEFGALSSIYGTCVSTLIALFIALPMGLVIALFLVELASPRISAVFGAAR